MDNSLCCENSAHVVYVCRSHEVMCRQGWRLEAPAFLVKIFAFVMDWMPVAAAPALMALASKVCKFSSVLPPFFEG